MDLFSAIKDNEEYLYVYAFSVYIFVFSFQDGELDTCNHTCMF